VNNAEVWQYVDSSNCVSCYVWSKHLYHFNYLLHDMVLGVLHSTSESTCVWFIPVSVSALANMWMCDAVPAWLILYILEGQCPFGGIFIYWTTYLVTTASGIQLGILLSCSFSIGSGFIILCDWGHMGSLVWVNCCPVAQSPAWHCLSPSIGSWTGPRAAGNADDAIGGDWQTFCSSHGCYLWDRTLRGARCCGTVPPQ